LTDIGFPFLSDEEKVYGYVLRAPRSFATQCSRLTFSSLLYRFLIAMYEFREWVFLFSLLPPSQASPRLASSLPSPSDLFPSLATFPELLKRSGNLPASSWLSTLSTSRKGTRLARYQTTEETNTTTATSGATSRSRTWTSGGQMPTWTTSIFSTRREDSTVSRNERVSPSFVLFNSIMN